jgi:hypothetical protein
VPYEPHRRHRLHQFAVETTTDFNETENIHLDNCPECRHRLRDAIQFIVLMRTEPEPNLIIVGVEIYPHFHAGSRLFLLPAKI